MKNNELKAANSLNSLSEQGRNSSYNIKKTSSRQLMRKKKTQTRWFLVDPDSSKS